MKILNYSAIGLFILIRPLLGPSACKHPVSCGIFALQELREKSFLSAIFTITKRVLTCI